MNWFGLSSKPSSGALESKVSALADRVAALEADKAALEGKVAALEAAAGGWVPGYDLPPFNPDTVELTLNRVGTQVGVITDALNKGGG